MFAKNVYRPEDTSGFGSVIFYTILLLVAAATLLHLGIIWHYAVDFPNADDFTSIVEPLLKIKRDGTVSSFFEALLKPHTQHRQVVLRLCAFLAWQLMGTLHIKALIALGSLWIFPWVYAFRDYYKNDPWIILVIVALLFQPAYSEAELWATNAIPYLWINSFAALAIERALKGSYWGLPWCALAVLSWGNGIFVAVLCTLIALGIRKWSHFSLYLLIMFGGLIMAITNSALTVEHNAAKSIGDIVLYFLRILGCLPGYYSRFYSLAFGIAISAITLLVLFQALVARKFNLHHVFLLFILGGVLSCALFRSSDLESSYTTSRYTLLSTLVILMLSLELMSQQVRSLRFGTAAVCFGICAWSNYSFFEFYNLRKFVVDESEVRWQYFGHDVFCPSCKIEDEILRSAESAGLMKRNLSPFIPSTSKPVGDISGPVDFVVHIEHKLQNEKTILVSGVAYDRDATNWNPQYAIQLSDGTSHEFECQTRPRISVILRDKLAPNKINCGFFCLGDLTGISTIQAMQLVVKNGDQVLLRPLKTGDK